MELNKAVTECWLENYVSANGLCSLCGNHGTINTTEVRSPAGAKAGRINFCICPNGQAMRAQGKPADGFAQITQPQTQPNPVFGQHYPDL